MREAVIVSTARTGIGRAYKGALNHTKSPTMLAHAIRHAVLRAGIDGQQVEDVVIGWVLSAGSAGNASQLSDGASACVLMERTLAERRGGCLWAFIAVWQWPAVRLREWVSGLYMPFPNCWRSMGWVFRT